MATVAIVGGGVGGCAAARVLAQRGHDVVLVERGPQLGGLVGSLEVGGTPIERFYHHIFPHELEVQALIHDVGLGDRLDWHASSVGVLRDGRIWPFTSPLDLLRFGPLPLQDRIRTGIGALRLGRTRSWDGLDDVTAEQWLTDACGRRAVDAIWRPLLQAKFGSAATDVPAAWMWGRFQQRSGARKGGSERLGYLRGGFRQLFDALEVDLVKGGVDLRLATTVESVRLDARGRANGLVLGDGDLDADHVLFAGPLPAVCGLVPGEQVEPGWRAAEGLGVVCAILEMSAPISDLYWTNVCDPALGFGGLIEHTNLLPASDYGGRHIAYLSRYFTHDEPIAGIDPHDEVASWIRQLASADVGFDAGQVLEVHVSRAEYAAPLVRLGHLSRIPPASSTSVPGLHLATTAQIYPQDRGMSEGVRLGAEVGEAIDRVTADRAAAVTLGCPVCGTRERRAWREMPDGGTEGGVDADAFRPSAERFGAALADIVRCCRCGHGWVEELPDGDVVAAAYTDATDPVSVREEDGQVETAARAIERIERHTDGRSLVDLGCWTGSFVVAAQQRGWDASGVEPSEWAVQRAGARGVRVEQADLFVSSHAPASQDAVAICDVLEHLEDPGAALDRIGVLLRPGGVLFLTVPDAGSPLARAMGRRWWSILPMHLQYFTRASMARLLEAHGFEVLEVEGHAKVFTARYYAERLGGYSAAVERGAVAVLERTRLADRLVGPDFHDRMSVLARWRDDG